MTLNIRQVRNAYKAPQCPGTGSAGGDAPLPHTDPTGLNTENTEPADRQGEKRNRFNHSNILNNNICLGKLRDHQYGLISNFIIFDLFNPLHADINASQKA